MSKTGHLWEVIGSRVLLDSGSWIKVDLQQVRLPDGRIVDNYHKVTLSDYVIVFAETTARKVILERQYKHGVGQVSLTLPAGAMSQGEEPLAAAQRELLEETGYAADHWQELGAFVVHGNYGCGRAHLFKATGAARVAEPDSGDLEEMEILLLKLEDVLEAVNNGDVSLLGTVAAIALATHPLISPDNGGPFMAEARNVQIG